MDALYNSSDGEVHRLLPVTNQIYRISTSYISTKIPPAAGKVKLVRDKLIYPFRTNKQMRLLKRSPDHGTLNRGLTTKHFGMTNFQKYIRLRLWKGFSDAYYPLTITIYYKVRAWAGASSLFGIIRAERTRYNLPGYCCWIYDI